MPITRSVLLFNQVQHQLFIEEDGTIDVESDPESLLLLNYEQEKKLCCSILDSKYFDGWQLGLDAP